MDEFANVSLPDDFDKILSVMRSRSVFVSIILQNLAQLKALFEKQWESIVGNCDEFLYLGGNEQSHPQICERIAGQGNHRHEHLRKEFRAKRKLFHQLSDQRSRLLTPDEVRMLDNRYAILFIRGELPVMDLNTTFSSTPPLT